MDVLSPLRCLKLRNLDPSYRCNPPLPAIQIKPFESCVDACTSFANNPDCKSSRWKIYRALGCPAAVNNHWHKINMNMMRSKR